MLTALRSQTLAVPRLFGNLGFLRSLSSVASASSASPGGCGDDRLGFLDLDEVQRVLADVKAGDVTVIPVRDQCSWTDHMVVATGRSAWHVRNIAQALIHKVKTKQKQQGFERYLLPSVEGHGEGKWVVIDSGNVIVHALDEKARAYYNLDSLWSKEASSKGPDMLQDMEEKLVKTRRRNNSKKPMKSMR